MRYIEVKPIQSWTDMFYAEIAGSYSLTVSLADATNTKWSDDSTSAIVTAWSVAVRSVTKPTISETSFTYSGSAHEPTITGFDSTWMSKSGDESATNAGSYSLTIALADSTNCKWSDDSTAAIVTAWSIAKATGSISVSPSSLSISGVGETGTATITKTGDGAVSVGTSDSSVATASISSDTLTVTSAGEGSATVTVTLADGDNYLGASCTLSVSVMLAHIYGVSWPKTSTTAFSRTDDAATFTDPVPAVSGGAGSSPFDNRLPWSGMVKETIGGNVMVKIPKFWYKWTNASGSLKLQISNVAQTGFYVSPAHADRGDGNGERDYVYIGRYHCDTNYKSTSGAKPKANIKRSDARTGCKGLGTGYYQLDYAMWWTIRMLYLVEFADWNSQAKIGYGCGDGSATHNSGASDSAQYHTGTMQANRTTYGAGVQYRFIEDPWGNVFDWCDGIVLSNNKAYVTNVIANYGESSTNHTKVSDGVSNTNEISGWDVPTTSGLKWALYPNAQVSNNNYDTYCADRVYVGSTSVVVYVGGSYGQARGFGMFCTYGSTASYTAASIGARLQYLP